jgi:hypothetical protein
MIKLMAVALLVVLFPAAMLGIVLGLLAHPYFFLLLLLLFLAWPSILVLTRQGRSRPG